MFSLLIFYVRAVAATCRFSRTRLLCIFSPSLSQCIRYHISHSVTTRDHTVAVDAILANDGTAFCAVRAAHLLMQTFASRLGYETFFVNLSIGNWE